MPTTIDVVLDLRESRRLPANANDFLSLWGELEERMNGASLQGSPSWQIETPTWGACGLLLADPSAAPGLVTDDTPFVVRSVLEPSRVVYKCATCLASKREEYGPFICNACTAEGAEDRVCDEHVVLLDGSLRATCPRHKPNCSSCGSAATFWCRGPRCRGTTAHCDRHRRFHPGDQAISYCPECYAVKFPECGQTGCTATGSLACDFVSQDTLKMCGARACSQHAFRWQLLGPHKRGPVLCPDHKKALPSLSREQLVFQIVATASGLNSRSGGNAGARQQGPWGLPRLSIVRHIFINTRSEALPIALLNTLFTRLQHTLADAGLQGRMRRALERQEKARIVDVTAAEDDEREGMEHFVRLQQLLIQKGRHDLANSITFSDYRKRANILRVRVPQELIGLFYGRQGSNIKSLSEDLGLTVKREEK